MKAIILLLGIVSGLTLYAQSDSIHYNPMCQTEGQLGMRCLFYQSSIPTHRIWRHWWNPFVTNKVPDSITGKAYRHRLKK